MYTQEDFAAIDRQYKRRLLWSLIPVSILLIGLIFSFIVRIEWLSVVLLIAAGALFIFLWDTVLSPFFLTASFCATCFQDASAITAAASRALRT